MLALSPDVERALQAGVPVVALESAVITHGLPYPRNLEVALGMEREVAKAGATPATIAVLDGDIRIGVGDSEMRRLAEAPGNLKIGIRDLAAASIRRACGGTTVAATMFAARRAGIVVFATGGIGGVHKESAYDISADLPALAYNRMVVVCAGAKAILNLEATLEVLENASVPVLGYGTDEFPAFYCAESGLPTSARADSPSAVAQYWERHCALGLESAVLVANPIPKQHAIGAAELGAWIDQASTESRAQGVRGQGLTPFLLRRIGELSGGRTIEANTVLLLNNARLAGQIAATLAMPNHDEERIEP
jgi:pseudouridylate synthase